MKDCVRMEYMDIKLIALDLDGTLLDEKKHLSEKNRKVLMRCIEKGIFVVPTTGRTVIGIPKEVLSIPGVRYAITVNGAMVEDLQGKRVLHEELLSAEKTLQVLEITKKYPVMYDVYMKGRGKSEQRFLDHMDQYNIKPEIQDLVRRTRDVVDDICQYVAQGAENVDKVNMFFGDMQVREMVREELKKIPEIIVTSSMKNNLEINSANATKGNGILALAKSLGVSPEQTMAFGDGENDISMIQMAHFGVAMGNASSFLQSQADYVTLSNEQDGVAAAIEKFVLCE